MVIAYITGSLPPREAWIEMSISRASPRFMSSLPPREAWIEILPAAISSAPSRSLPPREAWIEIFWPPVDSQRQCRVASPAGSVD